MRPRQRPRAHLPPELAEQPSAVNAVLGQFAGGTDKLSLDWSVLFGGGGLPPGMKGFMPVPRKSIFDIVSYKVTNPFLDLKKLALDGPSFVVEIAAGVTLAIAVPLLAPFVGLAGLRSVRNFVQIKLSEHHAAAIVAMWRNTGDRTIDHAPAFRATNALLAEHDRDTLDDTMFHKVINELSDLGCIEIVDGRYHLVEKVHFYG